MKLVIDLPPREEQMAMNRQRWEDLCANQRYAELPDRFETDGFGNVIMSPPPAFRHARYCAFITRKLEELLPGGFAFESAPLSTTDGVRVPDVVWGSQRFVEEEADDFLLETAPEICIEVLSPSNSGRQLEHKKALYFEAGAMEVWICDTGGAVRFFSRDAPTLANTESPLVPEFPQQIVL